MGATPTLEPGELTVFAAASLTEAFEEIGSAFELAHPGSTVVFNFAGSQTLRTQIEQGAAADVFASASMTEMDALLASGDAASEADEVFARNRLVVVTSPQSTLPIESLADLARPGLKIVLAAEEVPVGRYSRQALANLEASLGDTYAEEVLGNVVSLEENVRQVLGKVALGEADAGIVYTTDAVTAPTLPTIGIDDPYNVEAEYPLAVLTESIHPRLARAFVDFVLSAAGQEVLQSHGFLPAEGG
jgi:molybdate transport system substrate-binding protein